MRSGGPSAYPASTQQILELRDQGLTWNEVATQLGMTVSGAWSRYRRARPAKPPRLGRWQQVLADGLEKNLAIGVRAAVADHLGRAPTRAGPTAARRAAHSLASSAARSIPNASSCREGRLPATVRRPRTCEPSLAELIGESLAGWFGCYAGSADGRQEWEQQLLGPLERGTKSRSHSGQMCSLVSFRFVAPQKRHGLDTCRGYGGGATMACECRPG